jgi:hypothetical protein
MALIDPRPAHTLTARDRSYAEKHAASGAKMPVPWFTGSTMARPLTFLIDQIEENRLRPLQEGERYCGPFILPPFQRPATWSLEQKVALIESIWAGLPIGSLVVNVAETYASRFSSWLIDGQQRATAITEYAADAFPVNGCLWSELAEVDRRVFRMAKIISVYETKFEDEDVLREVYNRLAYGGTAHTEEQRA